MIAGRLSCFALLAAALVLVLAPADASGQALQPAPSPAPTATASAPAPSPPPALDINGQVIDLERGFIVFSSGDAFRLAPDVTIVDDATGAPPLFALDPGFYAVASLNASTDLVETVRVSQRPLPQGTPAAQIPHHYAVEASPYKNNPELIPRKGEYENRLSKYTTVTLVVEVPADTPFTDDVYLATDTSGWNAQAIKLQRADGLHYRIQVDLSAGTDFHYLFTRGSWKSVERDQSGLERAPRELYVPGGAASVIEAHVYRWADLP